MSGLSVLERLPSVNGTGKRQVIKPKTKAKQRRKGMKHARRLACAVGAVGVGVLGLSVAHCTESIGPIKQFSSKLVKPSNLYRFDNHSDLLIFFARTCSLLSRTGRLFCLHLTQPDALQHAFNKQFTIRSRIERLRRHGVKCQPEHP